MCQSDVKRDIKIIFFIINSFVGLLPGQIILGLGFAIGVSTVYRALTAGCMAIGLIILGVTTLGYAGVILENKIMLFVYSGLMPLIAVGNIILYTMSHTGSEQFNNYDAGWLSLTFAHLFLVLMAVTLALVSARQARKSRKQPEQDQGLILSPESSPASYAHAM